MISVWTSETPVFIMSMISRNTIYVAWLTTCSVELPLPHRSVDVNKTLFELREWRDRWLTIEIVSGLFAKSVCATARWSDKGGKDDDTRIDARGNANPLRRDGATAQARATQTTEDGGPYSRDGITDKRPVTKENFRQRISKEFRSHIGFDDRSCARSTFRCSWLLMTCTLLLNFFEILF